MKGWVPKLILLLGIHCGQSSAGNLTLTRLTTHAVLGRPFRFRCDTRGPWDSGTTGVLIFKLNMLPVCVVSRESCMQFGPIDVKKYSCACVHQAGDPVSFVLDIMELRNHTLGSWPCEYWKASNNITLEPTDPTGPDSPAVSPSNSVIVAEKHNLTLTCTAECIPDCTFSWFKVKDNVVVKDNYTGSSSLVLTSVTPETGGNYTCVAVNPVSEKSEMVSVEVKVPKCQGIKRDLIILLDSSSSVGQENFDKAKEFLVAIISELVIGVEGYQIGVVKFSESVFPVAKLVQYKDKTGLIRAIRAIDYKGGGTNTARAIWAAMKLFGRTGNRGEVPDQIITLTDGTSDDAAFTASQIEAARAKKIEMISIGVGSDINRKELRSLASNESMMYVVHSYDDIDSIKTQLIASSCGVTTTSKTTTTTTTTTTVPTTTTTSTTTNTNTSTSTSPPPTTNKTTTTTTTTTTVPTTTTTSTTTNTNTSTSTSPLPTTIKTTTTTTTTTTVPTTTTTSTTTNTNTSTSTSPPPTTTTTSPSTSTATTTLKPTTTILDEVASTINSSASPKRPSTSSIDASSAVTSGDDPTSSGQDAADSQYESVLSSAVCTWKKIAGITIAAFALVALMSGFVFAIVLRNRNKTEKRFLETTI